MKLYNVTIRRTFADDDKWKPGVIQETAYPTFADNEQHALDRHPTFEGFGYIDEPIRVMEMDYDSERKRVDQFNLRNMACCDKAVLRPCVCAYSFLCPIHGVNCHGTHD